MCKDVKCYVVTKEFTYDGVTFHKGCVLKVLESLNIYITYIETLNKISIFARYIKLHDMFREEYNEHIGDYKGMYEQNRSWCIRYKFISSYCEEITNNYI